MSRAKRHLKPALLVLALSILLGLFFSRYVYGSASDWLSQHTVFPEYFRSLFYETGELFPSFAPSLGLGQNIFHLSYYGLLSPLILPSYLFPFLSMVTYLTIVSIASILAGALLLYHWTRGKGLEKGTCLFLSLMMLIQNSIVFHFAHHIMFVNYMPFLILCLIGVDRYFKNGSKVLMILSFFLIIMVSFFYSVSSLLVIFIYMLYMYYKNRGFRPFRKSVSDFIKSLLPFGVSILMAMVLLLPTAAVLLEGRDSGTSMNLLTLLLPKFNFSAFLYDPYSIGFTSIGCISAVLGLVSKDKSQRLLSGLILLCVTIPLVSFVLNGGLYLRDKAYIPFIPLVMLLVGFAVERRKNIFHKVTWILLGIMICLFLIFPGEAVLSVWVLLLDIVLTVASLRLVKSDKIVHGILLTLSLCLTVFYLFFNPSQYQRILTREQYTAIKDPKKTAMIEELLAEDKGFYRIADLTDTSGYDVNTVSGAGDYKASIFSSSIGSGYRNYMNQIIGISRYSRYSLIYQDSENVVLQMLTGARYVISDHANAPVGYTLHRERDGYFIFRNNEALSLGVGTDRLFSMEDFSGLSYGDQLYNLSSGILLDRETDTPELLHTKEFGGFSVSNQENIKLQKTERGYLIEAEEGAKIILKLDSLSLNDILFLQFSVDNLEDFRDCSISINGVSNILTSRNSFYYNENTLFRYVLSSNSELKTLEVHFSKGRYELTDFSAQALSYSDYLSSIKPLDQFVVDTAHTKGDKITGSIDSKKDQMLLLSIPYDRGFTITVDGEIQKYEQVNGGLIGLPISKGRHEITLSYRSPGKTAGMFLSAFGVLLFIAVALNDRLRCTTPLPILPNNRRDS